MQFNDLKFELLRYGTNTELKSSTSYVSPSFNLIEENKTVKDLGVTLSSDGTFKTHINNIVDSAKKHVVLDPADLPNKGPNDHADPIQKPGQTHP